jgi:hypothetical protein
MTMKRKNLVLAAVIALVSAALAGTALAQVPQAGNQGSFFNAQQYGRGGDFGRNHEGGFGSPRNRFRAMDLDGRWVADGNDANTGWERGDFRGRGPMKAVQLSADARGEPIDVAAFHAGIVAHCADALAMFARHRAALPLGAPGSAGKMRFSELDRLDPTGWKVEKGPSLFPKADA